MTTITPEKEAELRAMMADERALPWSSRTGVTYDAVVKTCVYTHEQHAFIVATINALPDLLATLSTERQAREALAGRLAKYNVETPDQFDAMMAKYIDRMTAAEKEVERLRVAILGGEDAPGLAMSLTEGDVLNALADNYRLLRERAEAAEAAAEAMAGTLRSADYAFTHGMFNHRADNAREIIRCALSALPPPVPTEEGGEPVGWLHIMHMEGGQTAERVTLDKHHGWGMAGRDYDASYRITSEPLFTAPTQAQDVAGLVEVPRRPTREMLNAAIDVDSFKLGDISPLGFRMSPQVLFEKCWTAMVDAALLRTSPTREVEGFVEAAADNNRAALVEALAEPLAAWAEADAARCAAVEAYNARLAFVNAQRDRGDWSERTEPEYRIMDETAYLTRVAIQAMSEARQALAAAQPRQQAASAAATTNNPHQEGKAS